MLTKRTLIASSLVLLSGIAACSNQPAAKPEPAAQAQPAAQAASPAPGQAQAPAAAAVETVTGAVIETMDAASYTYVKVKTASGDLWAASAQFKVAVGDRVVVPLEMPMQNFSSKSLKRDFPLIYFASRIMREGEAAQPMMMSAHGSAAPAGAPAAAPGAKTVEGPINVTPAPGGMTVADIWAKRKSLIGKTVVVRGKVVKFTGGVLGVNWIHLQDGTGVEKDRTNDLTVNSKDVVNIGDVVTATGKIAIEKDLGSGYSYPVLLEDAKIVVK